MRRESARERRGAMAKGRERELERRGGGEKREPKKERVSKRVRVIN